jgi:hypothetical protein
MKLANVNNVEGSKNYRKKMRNKLKIATDTTKKKYRESICDEVMEFQGTGRYDLMFMKTQELV